MLTTDSVKENVHTVQEGFLPPAVSSSRWHQSVQTYYMKLKTKAHKCQIWFQFNVIEDRFKKYFPDPFANQCRVTPRELNFQVVSIFEYRCNSAFLKYDPTSFLLFSTKYGFRKLTCVFRKRPQNS